MAKRPKKRWQYKQESSNVAAISNDVAVDVVLLPELVELGDKFVDDGRIVGHDNVLVVAHDGRARPVEGTVDQ